MKRFITLSAIFCLLTVLSAYSAGNYSYKQESQSEASSPIKGQVVYIPTGTTTEAVVSTPISSETLTLGSNVSLVLNHDFSYNGKTIAQKGSVVEGTVVVAKKAGRANMNGKIMVRFNTITTPQGYRIPISAVIKTDDNTGVLVGGTKKDAAIDYTKNTVIGAGGGAVLGTALGALAGGSVGKGAVYGTAIGAGLGLAKGLADKGGAVEIPVNSVIEIYFDQPVTTASPTQGYSE